MSNLQEIYKQICFKRRAKFLHGTMLHRWRRQPPEQWQITRQRIWERDEGICQSPDRAAPKQHGLCSEKISLEKCHIDHIRPLTSGGSNHASNLRVLCPVCHALRLDHSHQSMTHSMIRKGLIPVNWKDYVWE